MSTDEKLAEIKANPWVVTVHSTGGSMGEAVPPQSVFGCLSEADAKSLETWLNEQFEAIYGPRQDYQWAIASPITADPNAPTAYVAELRADWDFEEE